MDEPGKHYAQWKGPNILRDPTYMRNSESSDTQEQKVAWWWPGAGERGMGARVSIWEDEKVLEVDDSDVSQHCKCTQCHWIECLKMVKIVNFMLHTFWWWWFSHYVMSDSLGPQASLYMGFPRKGYRSGLPFPSPGDLPDVGIEPGSPAL